MGECNSREAKCAGDGHFAKQISIDTGTIGPVINMPYFAMTFGQLDPSTQGLVVSMVMLSAMFLSFFAGSVSDSLGRPRCIAIGALIYMVGAALETGAMSLGMLIAGRLLVGAGQGLFYSIIIVYTSEISPPRWRGALCTSFQLMVTFGLMVGFFSTYGSVNIASTLSWRLPFAIHTAFGLVLFCASIFYLPHSPRWLSYHGRKEEAWNVWEDLGVSEMERQKDVLSEPSAMQSASTDDDSELGPIAKRLRASREKIASFKAIFGRSYRKATILGLFMIAMQQLSGIDAVLYYAPVLFQQAGLSSSSASFFASGVSALCIFVFTILAVIYADTWGRRPSTIYGGLVLLACMLLMGVLYATGSVHGDSGAARWAVIVAIYIFSIVYSMTWAIGLRLFSSEIQPIETRATAMGLGQGASFLTNWLVAFTTPILLARASYSIYMLFSGCLALTILVAVFYMPETNGKDLEAARDAFANHKFDGLLAISRVSSSIRSASVDAAAFMKVPWTRSNSTEDVTETVEPKA